MPKSANGLLDFISCEKLDDCLYQGQSKDLNTGQVYGGQVLGQAINAASDTVDEARILRSAHAYFLRKGDVNEPITYSVDRTLDGRSVSSRVVVAKQHGKQMLHLSASYHRAEEGLDYKPEVDVPSGALDKAIKAKDFYTNHFQFEYLNIVPIVDTKIAKNAMQFWVKTKERLPGQLDKHESMLTYISDSGLLFSALVPHGLQNRDDPNRPKIMMASIDHAIWLHRPFRVDDWFFYDCRSVSTSGGRALCEGRLYDRKGRLFASTMQEGILRVKDK